MTIKPGSIPPHAGTWVFVAVLVLMPPVMSLCFADDRREAMIATLFTWSMELFAFGLAALIVWLGS